MKEKPIITPYQFNEYTSQLSEIYGVLELELFEQIAKRLKTPGDINKDHVLEWQTDKMRQLRMLNLETVESLSKTTGLATTEIQSLFRNVGFDSIESIDKQLARLDRDVAPFIPSELDRRMESYVNQVFDDLNNYVNQTLVDTNYGQGTVSRTYTRIVEETTARVLASNITVNAAVTQTVIKWAEHGINTGFVDRGGRTWTLEHYADTVVRSTVNNAYNELRLSRMKEYDVDLVRVNSYSSARPSCAKIQGRVATMNEVSYGEYPSVYEFGYGTPGGLRGINCRHILYPFIEGVNTNNETPVDEEKANEEYKLTQQQRGLERRIKESKRSLLLAERMDDPASVEKYKKQLRNRQANVRDFVAEHDLPRRYDKERIIYP